MVDHYNFAFYAPPLASRAGLQRRQSQQRKCSTLHAHSLDRVFPKTSTHKCQV